LKVKFIFYKDDNRESITENGIKKTKNAKLIKPNFSEIYSNIEFKKRLEKLVLKLSSLYKARKFKKYFQDTLKNKLADDSKNFIKKILLTYDLSAIEKAEAKRIQQFTNSGWKKFYPENSGLFNNYFGKVHSTKIFFNNFSQFYSGTVNKENQKHGFGTLIDKDGRQYEGKFYQDQINGWCEYIDNESNIFQGFFFNNKLTGKGQKFSFNGDFYEGDFYEFQKQGQGFEETKDYKYNGSFFNDKKNFKGKIEFKQNKDIFDGDFKDDAITGNGKYLWGNGDKFNGSFLNGKMHGYGFYQWPDGSEYEGSYVDNIKNGKGKFKWSNGKIFEGPFLNGKQHGKGKLIYPDGRVRVIFFEEGKMKIEENKIDNPKIKKP